MEELCRKYNYVRVNRVRNSNLTFDFSIPNINGILVIGAVIMTILAFIAKEYKLLLFDLIAIIYFVIVKIQNEKVNFKTGFISFKSNSIIRTASFGKEVIDCTKGITINVSRIEDFHRTVDDEINARLLNKIFDEKDVTYQLVVNYKDKNENEQNIVLASTTSDNSKEEFEKFITNFYYKEEPKENQEYNEQGKIRFCM